MTGRLAQDISCDYSIDLKSDGSGIDALVFMRLETGAYGL